MGCDGYIKGKGLVVIENGGADITCYICGKSVNDLDDHIKCKIDGKVPVYINTLSDIEGTETYVHGYEGR